MNRLRLIVFTALAGVVLHAGDAAAASFDCKKAGSAVEHLICDAPELSSFDSQLEEAYLGALDRSNAPESVKAQQRTWLKQRNACADTECLAKTYRERIDALSLTSDQPEVCGGSTTPEIDACAAEGSRRADRELDRYVAAARKRLIEEGQESPEAKTALAGFDAAQAAWVTFRKAECDAIYDWWSGGTIRGLMFQGCWREATKSRTAAIWSRWLGYGDSTPPILPEPSP